MAIKFWNSERGRRKFLLQLLCLILIPTPGPDMPEEPSRARHVDNPCSRLQYWEENLTSSLVSPVVGGKGNGGLLTERFCCSIFKCYSSIVDQDINPIIGFFHEFSQLHNCFFISKIKYMEFRVKSFFLQLIHSSQSSCFIPGSEINISLKLLTKTPHNTKPNTLVSPGNYCHRHGKFP